KLEADQLQERRAVVAAKLHGLSDVLAVLGDEQKLEYFGGIAKRLKIANTELEIFSDDGEHLVWSDVFEERGILESHLLALRAIFAKPLEIDGKQVDVTVTFSADLSFTDAASRRIGNAIALVDKTSLADLPILLDDQQDVMDREWKVSLQSSIDNALQTGAIFAVFQPKVSLKTGRICGYEALVRWNDPERGFISPAYFIEQCEQAGRMEKLTRFMLEESMRKFQVSDAYQYGGTLSVNVSSTMLSNTSLPEIVCDILEKVGFPEDRLIIEVTETARIHDQLTARSVLSALSAVGVGLSLDDFGTGSAGLETLYNYPFSEIKIDRAFVKDITTSAKARTICEEVVTLGKKLRMNLVAEGIEDQETLQLLTDMGCPTAQGYYLGRPEPTPALDALQKVRLAKN
ncbi:MAG: EAL domain-containing protein, partial [Hyphomicrobiales bacterium]